MPGIRDTLSEYRDQSILVRSSEMKNEGLAVGDDRPWRFCRDAPAAAVGVSAINDDPWRAGKIPGVDGTTNPAPGTSRNATAISFGFYTSTHGPHLLAKADLRWTPNQGSKLRRPVL